MKLYLASGTYYEKQIHEKGRDSAFCTIEFPFSATPKSEFVNWLNKQGHQDQGEPSEELPVDLYIRKNAERLASQPPKGPSNKAAQTVAFEDGFQDMPLATKLHYAALALEEARERLP